MAKGKNVLTTGDVARICNVAPRTVSKWFDSGQLKGYRIPGSKDRRIPVDELYRFMKVHNMPTLDLGSSKIRILIVDSDKNHADALSCKIVSRGEYEVQTVQSSFETGLVAHRFSPHIMILNLLAKGIDAAGLCEGIRSEEDLQTVKIIALAGHLGPAEGLALLNKGFDDYVTDPANVDELVRKIDDAVAVVY